jgi:hypothetical protein
MRAISREDGQRHLDSIGVHVELEPHTSLPRYRNCPGCRVFETSFDDHFQPAQDMARELVTPSSQPKFPGGIVWLHQWGIDWNPIADYTLARFLKSYGIDSPVTEKPVYIADSSGARDVVAAMGLMMTYGCDVFFVAADATYMVLSCNESILTLVTASEREYKWYHPIIEPLKFNELRADRNTFGAIGQ